MATTLLAYVEIDPPHRDGAEKGDDECEHYRGRRGHAGRGAPCHQDRFPERDDDEERAALREVTAVDIPVRRRGTPESRNHEPDSGTHAFQGNGDEPPRRAFDALDQRPSDPQHADQHVPHRDVLEVAEIAAIVKSQRPSMNTLRPICIDAYASANRTACDSNAPGIDADSNSPANMSAKSITRTAGRCGSS